MNILAITGALRKDSYNTQLLKAVQELAPKGFVVRAHEITLHGLCASCAP